MKHRRICILTQPVSNGFGGLLQAYALQTIIKRMGHEVWTEDRKRNCSRWNRFIAFVKSIVIYLFAPVLHYFTKVYFSTPRTVHKINQNTDYFKFKYIRTTVPIYSNDKKRLRIRPSINRIRSYTIRKETQFRCGAYRHRRKTK